MSGLTKLLAQLRARIPEVEPLVAFEKQSNGALLIDVREPEECSAGVAPGALLCSRSLIESRIEAEGVDSSQDVILICASGERSLLACANLHEMGFQSVSSVKGGISKWIQDGLPIEIPMQLTALDRDRYRRHLALPQIGEPGQLRLKQSRIAIVGAGGLGSPAAFYLAAAGVGSITLIDRDVVERSNLQRQILHRDADVGRLKVQSAREVLNGLNPAVTVEACPRKLTADNASALLRDHDVVIDGTDNFDSRYVISDVCAELGVPLVHGSVFRFEGQVSVFWPARLADPGPCYRCLFPKRPADGLIPSCTQAGVLGVLPGVIGSLQSLEALKIVLGIGDVLVGRVLVFDAWNARFNEYRLDRDPDCAVCLRAAKSSTTACCGQRG